MRTLLVALLLLPLVTAHGQAPIERREPAAPVLDPDWQRFAQKWNLHQGAEVQVQGWGHTLHCHLDFISNENLECIRYGRRSWFVSETDIHYYIPRQNVREIHTSSRAASALIGIAVGFGIAAIAAPHNEGGILLGSLIFAPIGGSIGYQFPLRGPTLFRAR